MDMTPMAIISFDQLGSEVLRKCACRWLECIGEIAANTLLPGERRLSCVTGSVRETCYAPSDPHPAAQ